MTILYALLVLLVTMLGTTIISLYDLNYIDIHLDSLNNVVSGYVWYINEHLI